VIRRTLALLTLAACGDNAPLVGTMPDGGGPSDGGIAGDAKDTDEAK